MYRSMYILTINCSSSTPRFPLTLIGSLGCEASKQISTEIFFSNIDMLETLPPDGVGYVLIDLILRYLAVQENSSLSDNFFFACLNPCLVLSTCCLHKMNVDKCM